LNNYFLDKIKEYTVYDGIVQLKSESSAKQKIKEFVGMSDKGKVQEQERGVRAMLPAWGKEIQQGRSVQSLVDWVLLALDRQVQCLSKFVEFVTDNDFTRYREAKKTVQEVTYVEDDIEKLTVLIYVKINSLKSISLVNFFWQILELCCHNLESICWKKYIIFRCFLSISGIATMTITFWQTLQI